jgi:hypothetical protein
VAYTRITHEGREIKAPIYALNSVTFGDVKLRTHSWLITQSDTLNSIKKEGYDGILGTRIFEGFWCELSFSKRKIILHKEKPDYFTSHIPVKILTKYNADFHIPVTIDNREFYFNIDTGLHHGIYFPDGIIRFKTPDEYREILSDEEVRLYHLVKAGSIEILDETYNDAFIMTNSFLAQRWDDPSNNDIGLLGLSFLKYYDFLFDFKKLRSGKTTGLYYKPNTPLEERDYGFFSFMKDEPEFGILNFGIGNSEIVILSVIKDSVAYSKFGLRPGTVITKINGKSVSLLSREDLTAPSFYLSINNFTLLEGGRERTFTPPLNL